MLNLLKVLRQDEHGVILSTEIVIIGSLLVIGLITGLTCLQKSVNGELHDLAGAIGALDQTYSFSAHRKSGFGGNCCAYAAGSSYDNCENKDQKCGDIVGCIDTTEVQAASCSNCGSCGQCASSFQTGSACGTCGGHASHGTGCSTCGSHGIGSSKNTRCIDTGIPRMKVTEWRGSRQPLHQHSIVQPHSEVIVVPEHSEHDHSQIIIENHDQLLPESTSIPMLSIQADPPPSPAPILTPNSATAPPAPIPMPPQDLPLVPEPEVPPSA